jgi:hypothetical protein
MHVVQVPVQAEANPSGVVSQAHQVHQESHIRATKKVPVEREVCMV